MAKRERKPKRKTFSDELRAAIDEYEPHRNALCDAAEVDKSFLSHFMHGRKRLTNETIDKLWAAMNLKIESRDE